MGRLKRKVKNNYNMISKEIDDVNFGVDVRERESQVAVLGNDGSVVMEKRISTWELKRFISGFPANEKHVAIYRIRGLHPSDMRGPDGHFVACSYCSRYKGRQADSHEEEEERQ